MRTNETTKTIKEGDLVFVPPVGMCRIDEIIEEDDDGKEVNLVLAEDAKGGWWAIEIDTVLRGRPSPKTVHRLRSLRHHFLTTGKWSEEALRN